MSTLLCILHRWLCLAQDRWKLCNSMRSVVVSRLDSKSNPSVTVSDSLLSVVSWLCKRVYDWFTVTDNVSLSLDVSGSVLALLLPRLCLWLWLCRLCPCPAPALALAWLCLCSAGSVWLCLCLWSVWMPSISAARPYRPHPVHIGRLSIEVFVFAPAAPAIHKLRFHR